MAACHPLTTGGGLNLPRNYRECKFVGGAAGAAARPARSRPMPAMIVAIGVAVIGTPGQR